jgi:hypothetical protein
MLRTFAVIVLIAYSGICLNGQSNETKGCLSQQEFAPVVVNNPESKVTFRCDRATPVDLIRATGRQTRIPIGLVLGPNPGIFSKAEHSYDLEKVDARFALLEAIQGTGYTLIEENNLLVLIAGDLSPRQRQLLTQPYAGFRPGAAMTMVGLGVQLTMWMRVAIHPTVGFGASIPGSTNDERFNVEETWSGTTEEIANRIVSLGTKGMWILRADPSPSSNGSTSDGSTDEIEIDPYQHYSNMASTGP